MSNNYAIVRRNNSFTDIVQIRRNINADLQIKNSAMVLLLLFLNTFTLGVALLVNTFLTTRGINDGIHHDMTSTKEVMSCFKNGYKKKCKALRSGNLAGQASLPLRLPAYHGQWCAPFIKKFVTILVLCGKALSYCRIKAVWTSSRAFSNKPGSFFLKEC